MYAHTYECVISTSRPCKLPSCSWIGMTYMCVCMYICMYVCVWFRVSCALFIDSMHACMQMCVCVCVCVCVHAHTYKVHTYMGCCKVDLNRTIMHYSLHTHKYMLHAHYKKYSLSWHTFLRRAHKCAHTRSCIRHLNRPELVMSSMYAHRAFQPQGFHAHMTGT